MKTPGYSVIAWLAAALATRVWWWRDPANTSDSRSGPTRTFGHPGRLRRQVDKRRLRHVHLRGRGSQKNRAKIAPDTLRLDQVCVNDPRLTSMNVAGGKTVPLTLKASGANHCASLGGATQLPETCTCVPPAGGDCTAPAVGFLCIAGGHVP